MQGFIVPALKGWKVNFNRCVQLPSYGIQKHGHCRYGMNEFLPVDGDHPIFSNQNRRILHLSCQPISMSQLAQQPQLHTVG